LNVASIVTTTETAPQKLPFIKTDTKPILYSYNSPFSSCLYFARGKVIKGGKIVLTNV